MFFNTKQYKSNQRGFIRTLILIIVALIVLQYYGIDLREIIQKTFSLLILLLKIVWTAVMALYKAVLYLFDLIKGLFPTK